MADPLRLALIEATAAIEDPDLGTQVRAAYAARGYAPFWTLPQAAPLRAALVQAMAAAAGQGLSARRHDPAALVAAVGQPATQAARARSEVALMSAFLSYATDLSSGQLTPRRVDGGLVRDIARPDPAQLLADFAAAPAPARFLRDLAPTDPAYLVLLGEKLRLERRLTQGEPARIDAKELTPGDSGPAVAALRDRLAALDYLPPARRADYGKRVEVAVRQAQADFGLAVTGKATKPLIDALNRPLAERLRSVIVNLERLRWMRGVKREGRYLWVNIPDFTVRLYDGPKLTFESVTVVGEDVPDHRTPEFSDVMDHMVVNPSWNVPRSITVREYLPKMQANPGAAGHLEVIDSRGRVVPRDQVNFAAYTEKSFPYRLRQPPAERNALGVVKFMFPNSWNIYLHDTPSKSLFSKTVRTFSHGCVRVGEPFKLADALLAPQSDDPRGLFRANLKGGLERSIPLKPAVPIHLVYFTAWPEHDGRITWRRDVYGRDRRIAAALDKAGVVFAGGGD